MDDLRFPLINKGIIMPTYVDAINKVLEHEGGFVDHKLDKGGATNWGITQRVYEEFVGRPVSKEEMKTMPKGNAIQIYKKNYWDKIKGDSIKDYAVAFLIFDAAVNSGVGNAVKLAQKIVGVVQDGGAGSKTVEAINKYDPNKFSQQYLSGRESFYKSIVDKNPAQSVFLKGWLNRVKANASEVAKWVGTPVGKVTVSITGILLVGGLGFFLYRWLKKK
jgi:lysozyme family protein